ncbi:MAG: hypothetical protein FWD89_02675, partial [Firmicutes bacterium]|nr:hypothetical protein [Bacillota bacterium]
MGTIYDVYLMGGAFLVFVGICVGLYFLLRNQPRKIKLIPFAIVAVILLTLELIKQFRGLVVDYEVSWIPVFICSIFSYLFPIVVIAEILFEFFGIGKGAKATRFREIMWGVTLSITTVVSVGILLLPAIITGSVTERMLLGTATYLNYHSYFYHILVVLFAMLAFPLKMYEAKWKDLKWGFIVFVPYLILATIITFVADHDYIRIIDFPFGNFTESNFLKVAILVPLYQLIVLCGFLGIHYIPKGVEKLKEKLTKKHLPKES